MKKKIIISTCLMLGLFCFLYIFPSLYQIEKAEKYALIQAHEIQAECNENKKCIEMIDNWSPYDGSFNCVFYAGHDKIPIFYATYNHNQNFEFFVNNGFIFRSFLIEGGVNKPLTTRRIRK